MKIRGFALIALAGMSFNALALNVCKEDEIPEDHIVTGEIAMTQCEGGQAYVVARMGARYTICSWTAVPSGYWIVETTTACGEPAGQARVISKIPSETP